MLTDEFGFQNHADTDLSIDQNTGVISIRVHELKNITAILKVCPSDYVSINDCNTLHRFEARIVCGAKSTEIVKPESLESMTQTFYIDRLNVPYFGFKPFTSTNILCPIVGY